MYSMQVKTMTQIALSSRRCLLALALLVLGACAGGEEYTYVPGNEMKPGSGLLSGKDGAFNLLGPGEARQNQAVRQTPGEATKAQAAKP